MPPDVRPDAGGDWPRALDDALRSTDAGAWTGAPVVFLDEVGSTSDEALRAAAAGAADGACVVARAQTAGRGRRGRTWASPPGAGLYCSFVIRPHETAGAPAPGEIAGPAMLITLMAAVAAVDALTRAAGFTPTIKWPNDIIVERGRVPQSPRWERRKLGGILAEAAVSGDALQHVVVGIGLNLARAAYPPEVAALATSVEAETGRPGDFFGVFAACRAALAHERAALFTGGAADLRRRWRAHAPSAVGALVAWQHEGRRLTGLTAGLDDSGALLVDPEDGGPRRHLVAGEVEWA